MKPLWSVLILLATLCACDHAPRATNASASAEQSEIGQAERIAVLLQPREGKAHRMMAELALSPEAQAKGLSGRAYIGPDEAMLFPTFPPRPASFWMKDTRVPLDILFIRSTGEIEMIAHNTRPMDLTPISTGNPVIAVLELAGGRAAQLGLEEGDKVFWGQCIDARPAETVRTTTNFCIAQP